MELKNKTVVFLGSSVTYGSAAGGISFADIMCKRCEADCIKEAVSGTTLADVNESSYVARLKKIDKNIDPSIFICQLSTNDATKKISLEEIRKSVCFILDYVAENFKCPIVFYTGTYFGNAEYEKMIELLYCLKNEYGFYILDFYNDEAMRCVNRDAYLKYMNDPIHPTLLGYEEWWTPKFIDFCKRLP